MRYIKYYENIDINKEKEDIKNICFEYLAFLYDEGFNVQIVKINGLNTYDFELSISKYKDIETLKKEHFKWIDVRDDIIPFYEILKDKYTLIDYFGGKANCEAYIEIFDSFTEYYICDYELEDLKLNDILSISFRVSKINEIK